MYNKSNSEAPDLSLPLIGIIGGVGPYAGIDFIKKILDNTRAVHDQEHLNCLLISCPSLIPDRTEFLLRGDGQNNPAHGLFKCAQRLYNAGARLAAVACNTAHAAPIFGPFCAQVGEHLPGMRIINMLEAAAAFVKDELQLSRIGLLATRGTHRSGVYHDYFRKEDGFILIEPDERGSSEVHHAIYEIKSQSNPPSEHVRSLLVYEINHLIGLGAQAVILGCSELPLAVESGAASVPLIDPGLVLARKLINISAPQSLAVFDEVHKDPNNYEPSRT
ncbi:aspartate/glutamate racemase family protein [Breznakiellaceae bacterium SP9]